MASRGNFIVLERQEITENYTARKKNISQTNNNKNKKQKHKLTLSGPSSRLTCKTRLFKKKTIARKYYLRNIDISWRFFKAYGSRLTCKTRFSLTKASVLLRWDTNAKTLKQITAIYESNLVKIGHSSMQWKEIDLRHLVILSTYILHDLSLPSFNAWI